MSRRKYKSPNRDVTLLEHIIQIPIQPVFVLSFKIVIIVLYLLTIFYVQEKVSPIDI
jgi:hypothetical protein